MSIVSGPGSEFADFGTREILFGLTSEEAWVNLSEEDLQVRSRHNRRSGRRETRNSQARDCVERFAFAEYARNVAPFQSGGFQNSAFPPLLTAACRTYKGIPRSGGSNSLINGRRFVHNM